MRIIEDDLSGPEVRALLELHFAGMLASSPRESCHFLDFDGLKAPGVTFWSIWDGNSLAGCGAVKEHDPAFAEVKSMRTAPDYLGKGVGRKILEHIIAIAKARGYTRLSLETGSSPDFDAAHALYQKFGFSPCPPFADYKEDPFSRYYALDL